jgi:hypothetical protein
MDDRKSYLKQIFIGTVAIYVVFIVLLAVGVGIAVSVVDSDTECYRSIIFFTVLSFIVIILGDYTLTMSL